MVRPLRSGPGNSSHGLAFRPTRLGQNCETWSTAFLTGRQPSWRWRVSNHPPHDSERSLSYNRCSRIKPVGQLSPAADDRALAKPIATRPKNERGLVDLARQSLLVAPRAYSAV